MMVGSNQRARQFFKQHGWYELGADKIEAKVCTQRVLIASILCLRSTILIAAFHQTACSSFPRGLGYGGYEGELSSGTPGLHAHASSCRSQYTSRAAQLYKSTLEKDVKKLSTQTPVSPTAAEAAKRGIDFLDAEVRLG